MIRFVIAIAAFVLAPATASWGAEWSSVTERRSRIVLEAPGLSDGTFAKRGQYWGNEESAFWRGGSGGMPLAEVYVRMLAPDRIYRTGPDLEKSTRQWNFLKQKDLEFAGEKTTRSEIGVVRHERFTANGLHCVSFLHTWGSSGGWDNDQGVPPNYLVGYYCDRGPLTDATVTAILGGIGVRGYYLP